MDMDINNFVINSSLLISSSYPLPQLTLGLLIILPPAGLSAAADP